MKIDITDMGECMISVNYECDKEEIDTKKNEVLDQFKNAPMKGFKGKPDMISIRMKYAKEIDNALRRALAEKSFHDTITEHDIKPFGMPEFSDLVLTDKKFSCTFLLRKKPAIELGTYKELEIPKPMMDTTIEAMAQQLLQDLRIKFGEGNPFGEDDFAQTNDNVIVDYEVFNGTDRVEQLCGKAQLLTIGRSHLKEFDQNLLGMKAGETREFSITVPDFGLPSVAGKSLKFIVVMNSGSKITPMPLDDSLAIKTGRKDLTELMQFATEYSSSRFQEQFKTKQSAAVSARLVADHVVAVPEWLTASERMYLTTSAKIDWSIMPDIDKEPYNKMAESNVKLSLILDKVRENEPEAQLADAEVNDVVRNMLGKMGGDEKKIEEMMDEMSKKGQMAILVCRIRDEYALDFIIKNTKWIE